MEFIGEEENTEKYSTGWTVVSINKVWWDRTGRGIQGIKLEGLYQPPPLKPASSVLNNHSAVAGFLILGKFL